MKDVFEELTIRLRLANNTTVRYKPGQTTTEDTARSLCGANYQLAIDASKGINMKAFVNNVQFNGIASSHDIVTIILSGLGNLTVAQHRALTI